MKTCSRCKVEKEISEFHKREKYKGKQYYHSFCKPCKRETDRQGIVKNPERAARNKATGLSSAKRNKNYVLDYLRKHPCVDCGESDTVVLEFDHVRGEKLNSISRLSASGGKLEYLILEIDKCEVRCANCHRRITAKRAGWKRHI